MTAWRVHLADEFISQLDILTGTPNVLCAWIENNYVVFYDLDSGAQLERRQIVSPSPASAEYERSGDAWTDFLASLRAPNGAFLPLVRLGTLTVHTTTNGQRLYDDGYGLKHVTASGEEVAADGGNLPFVSVAQGYSAGVVAALDEGGQLRIYKGEALVGQFDVGLQVAVDILPEVVLSADGGAIFASDGWRVVRVDGAGTVVKTLTFTYYVGRIGCSPDGTLCVTSDNESGVMRVYQGETMTFAYQKYALDLFAAAEPVQLLADVPTPRLAVTALAVGDGGVLAFAIDGIITVTTVDAMQKIPIGD